MAPALPNAPSSEFSSLHCLVKRGQQLRSEECRGTDLVLIGRAARSWAKRIATSGPMSYLVMPPLSDVDDQAHISDLNPTSDWKVKKT